MDKLIEELMNHTIIKIDEKLDKNQNVWYNVVCKDNFTLPDRKEKNFFKLSPEDKATLMSEAAKNKELDKETDSDEIDFNALVGVVTSATNIGDVKLNSSLLCATWYLEDQASSIVKNPLLKARYANYEDLLNPEATNPAIGDTSQCTPGKIIKYNNLVLVVQPRKVKDAINQINAQRSRQTVQQFENQLQANYTNSIIK